MDSQGSMKGVIVNQDGRWKVLQCDEFERDYHIRPKQGENIYALQKDPRGEGLYIISWPNVCGMFYEGRLFYVDYYPNILINGQPKMELIPDDIVRETIEEIYGQIREINEDLIRNPQVIIEYPGEEKTNNNFKFIWK